MKKLNTDDLGLLTVLNQKWLADGGFLQTDEQVIVAITIRKISPVIVEVSELEDVLAGEELNSMLARKPADVIKLSLPRAAAIIEQFLTVGHLVRWFVNDGYTQGYGPATKDAVKKGLKAIKVPLKSGSISSKNERKKLLEMPIEDFLSSKQLWWPFPKELRNPQRLLVSRHWDTIGSLVPDIGDPGKKEAVMSYLLSQLDARQAEHVFRELSDSLKKLALIPE